MEMLEGRVMLTAVASSVGVFAPSIGSSTLPTAVVASVPGKGSVVVDVANTGDALFNGSFTVDLAAVSTSGGPTVALGSTVFHGKVAVGTAAKVGVAVKSLPSSLVVGSYTLVATTVDGAGDTASSSNGPSLTVAAPFFGLSEAITATTLPDVLVSGVKVNSTLKLKITDKGNVPLTGKTNVALYASPTTGAAETVIVSVPEKLSIGVGKSETITLSIAQIPAVAAGDYFLVIQVTDPQGVVSTTSSPSAGNIAAPAFGLSESITGTTLPVSLVSGTKTKATVTVTVKDGGNVPLTGVSTVSLSASLVSGVPGTVIVSLPEKLSIKVGKTGTVVLPITAIPPLIDGDYFLIVQVTGPDGVVSTTSTPGSGRISPPFVALTAKFAALTKSAITSGATITLTNTGNVADITTLTETFGFSTDALGLSAIGPSSHVTTPTITIPAGKSVTLKLTAWKPLAAGLAAGDYFLTATITDQSTISVTAVSGTATVVA
jgi:hypothetical protein